MRDDERTLFSPPARFVGLGICKPTGISESNFAASTKSSVALAEAKKRLCVRSSSFAAPSVKVRNFAMSSVALCFLKFVPEQVSQCKKEWIGISKQKRRAG